MPVFEAPGPVALRDRGTGPTSWPNQALWPRSPGAPFSTRSSILRHWTQTWSAQGGMKGAPAMRLGHFEVMALNLDRRSSSFRRWRWRHGAAGGVHGETPHGGQRVLSSAPSSPGSQSRFNHSHDQSRRAHVQPERGFRAKAFAANDVQPMISVRWPAFRPWYGKCRVHSCCCPETSRSRNLTRGDSVKRRRPSANSNPPAPE